MKKSTFSIITAFILLLSILIPSRAAANSPIVISVMTWDGHIYNSSCTIQHFTTSTQDKFYISANYPSGVTLLTVNFNNNPNPIIRQQNGNQTHVDISNVDAMGLYTIYAEGNDGVSTTLTVNVVQSTPATTGV